MKLRALAIVGVGLIGGSIALAARAGGVARRIVGVGPAAPSRQNTENMLDACYTEAGPALREADAVVVCTPVDQIADQVAEMARWVRDDALITDVGSTKAVIVHKLVGQLRDGACFVGGHPLAGSEKSGPQFADAKLFKDRLIVLTPHAHFHPEALVRATALWQALGGRVLEMTPEEHDRAMAITSHLPHLIAAVLAAMLPAELRELAASGFRDTTRIAGGDPRLWTAIFQHNETAVAAALRQFQQSLLPCFKDADHLAVDQLHRILTDGKRNRDALGS